MSENSESTDNVILKERYERMKDELQENTRAVNGLREKINKINSYFMVGIILAGITGLSGAVIFSKLSAVTGKIESLQSSADDIDETLSKKIAVHENLFQKYLDEALSAKTGLDNGSIIIGKIAIEWGSVQVDPGSNPDQRHFKVEFINKFDGTPWITFTPLPSGNSATQGTEVASIEELNEKHITARLNTQRGDLDNISATVNYLAIGNIE